LAVLEKEDRVAFHQTGRNSGVIHSGLYYKPGSLKARLSTEGSGEMVDFCRDNQVQHEITGKVVVATRENEIPLLTVLYERGVANGVKGLEMIGVERLREIEPHASGLKALWVPGSGIVDYAGVCDALVARIQKLGGVLKTGTELLRAERDSGSWTLHTSRGVIFSDFIVNCGGLQSDRITRRSGFEPPARIIPFRGEYFQLTNEARSLVRNLIYPVPNPLFPFLGPHFTRMIKGGVEAGPNAVLALKREGYRKFDFSFVDTFEILSFPGFWKLALKYGREGLKEVYRSAFKSAFIKELQRLVPAVRNEHLVRGESGIRAQALDLSGSLLDDFKFLEVEGGLHVLNAPSPAATASLSIGRVIAEKVVFPLKF
jgi:L-2-hydroxyglutarate oxidase